MRADSVKIHRSPHLNGAAYELLRAKPSHVEERFGYSRLTRLFFHEPKTVDGLGEARLHAGHCGGN